MRVILTIFVLMQAFGSGYASLVSVRAATEVLINQSTYLNCSTSVLSDDIDWYHYDVGAAPHEMRSVYAYGQIYEFYGDDFIIDKIISNDTKAYNLVILSAKSKYAGTYVCQLTGSDGGTDMQLIVLKTPPLCWNNTKPDGVLGPNSCGMESEEQHLSCSVAYVGNIPVQLDWRRVDWSGPLEGNVTEETTSGIYKYNVTVKSDLNMDGSSFVCQTTRATGGQYSCTTDVVKVLYIVNTTYTTDKLINEVVDCSANTSSQSCRYKWMWFNETDVQTESNNETLKIEKTGQHRCEATCEIRNQECTVIASLVNAIADSKTTDFKDNPPAKFLLIIVLTFVFCGCIPLIVLVLWRCRMLRHHSQFHEAEERTLAILEEMTDLVSGGSHPESQASAQGDSVKTTETQMDEPRTEILIDVPPQESHASPEEAVLFDLNAKKLSTMTLEEAPETVITGLTMLSGELFIAFEGSSEVAVYQAELLIHKRSLTVSGLECPVDIASSSNDKCLYISSRDEIFKVDRDGDIIVYWRIEDGAGTLSVSQDQTLILSVLAKSVLREYSADGKAMCEIRLPSDVHLLHAVKTKNLFAVSIESHMAHNVWVVDVLGSVVQFFGGMVGLPKYLAVDSDGCLFVSDEQNSCVLLLSPTLECLKVILTCKDGIFSPSRLYLDEVNSRMFVADVDNYDVKVIAFELQKALCVPLPSNIYLESMQPSFKFHEDVM